ncbi:exopolysaccharide biosynthesis polyprenyl glycosylphosphotransferase [Paraflavisolibacter sp. H34]|uniref:exopolysaccharide biosynthesis polyprenyl glycosylphosphotransferase n=1 Tax=Huijunlia imazamoxiresistens TaxID=3127457 RepID=UPI00301932DC
MISLRLKRPSLFMGSGILIATLTLLVSIYFFRDYRFSRLEWVVLSGCVLLWTLIEYGEHQAHSAPKSGFAQYLSRHIKPYSVFLALVLGVYFFLPVPGLKRSGVMAIILGFPLLDIALYYLMSRLSGKLKARKDPAKVALVAGVGNVAKNVEKQLFSHQGSGYQIKGFIHCKKNEPMAVEQDKVIGDLDHIHEYLKENPVDEIVIALPVKRSKKLKNILSVADYHGIRVKCVLDYSDVFGENYKINRYGQIDAVDARQFPMDSPLASFFKNCFDKAFASLVLLFLSPLFLTLAALIKLDSPGPVFYCPVRIGKNGKPFKVYKFRSMRQGDDASGGVMSTQKDDPRITRLGAIIRKYSLDELPQFINVLLGDMSVVGPRPHRRFLDRQLQESVYKYMIRHYVKPGITGWAQVNGWRGPTDTEEQRMQRTSHDLWYIENWNFWLDIKIIYLTVFGKKTHSSAF